MGTSQSTDVEKGANVNAIIGSESRYSFLDLSSWQGLSVAMLMLFIALLCAVLLFAFRKYRQLKKRLMAPRDDVEASPRRNMIEMTDLAQLGTLFRTQSVRKCMDVNCSLKSIERAPAKCNNSCHLALEKERRSQDAPAKE